MEKTNKIIAKLKAKGFVESAVHSLTLIWSAIFSCVYTIFLRLRGYHIDYGVCLTSTSRFFQSNVGAIRIRGNCKIGHNTRINSGFGGKIDIGKNVLIDDNTHILSQKEIKIGEFSQISSHCLIVDFNHIYSDKFTPIVKQGCKSKSIYIGSDVWVGSHVIILPGVHIGKGSVIGAGSVVTKDIAAYSVVAGNPAKIIRKRS